MNSFGYPRKDKYPFFFGDEWGALIISKKINK